MASFPVMRCDRFSLVDTWTVNPMFWRAIAVWSVSGAAERKFPPMQKNTSTFPSSMAWMALTTSYPWCCGIGNPRPSSMRCKNAFDGASQMPTVRSPCTLEWPRTGQKPAPGRPTCPLSRSKFTTSWMTPTPFRCCVRPMAQHAMVADDCANMAPASLIWDSLSPESEVIEFQSIVSTW